MNSEEIVNCAKYTEPPLICLHVKNFAGGGAEKVIVYLANYLSKAGYKVEITVSRAIGPYASLVDESVNVVELLPQTRAKTQQADLGGSRRVKSPKKSSSKAKRISGFATRWITRIFLARYLRIRRPAVLISAMNEPNTNAYFAKKISMSPVKIIATQHSNFTVQNPNKSMSDKFRKAWVSLSLRRANKVVCVSKGVSDDLSKALDLDDRKIKVIPNPIVSPSLDQKSIEPLGSTFYDKTDATYFIFVGRLKRVKRVDDVIQAFAKVSSQANVFLSIVGEGPLRGQLETLAHDLNVSKRVNFFGFQTNPYKHMAASDCLVLSSEHEGWGNVIIEALFLGKKVLSSDCDFGPREILEDSNWESLFPVGEVDKLAELMLEAATDDEKISKSWGRKKAQGFSWQEIGPIWDELLDSFGIRLKQGRQIDSL